MNNNYGYGYPMYPGAEGTFGDFGFQGGFQGGESQFFNPGGINENFGGNDWQAPFGEQQGGESDWFADTL